MKRKNILFIAICLFLGFNQLFAQTGQSLHFDGVDDEVFCGNNASLQITGSNITLECRIKIHSFRTNIWEGNIINKEQGGLGTDFGYMLRVGGNGVVNFNLGNGSWNELNSPDNSVTLGTWYRIAATYDGTNMRIYLDGVEIARQNTGGIQIGNSTSNLTIGNWALGAGRNLNATIDEIRIWNVTRTSSEIASNMNIELNLPQTGLVAYYKFNQGIANGNNINENIAVDEIGTNNGALMNFALSGMTSNWIGETTLSVLEQEFSNVKIFPNPSKDFIQISNLNKPINYKIYNLLGEEIQSGTSFNNQKINIQNLKSGLYFLNFNEINTIKFIKS